MIAGHWQWFLLSVVICLCAAQLYIHYATPVYKFSGRLLVNRSDNYHHRGAARMRTISNLGEVRNTEGVDNEMEKLWSCTLMRDVVKSLKLYASYGVKEGRRKRLVYGTQPVSADLDPAHLDSIDKIAYEEFCMITMQMKRQSNDDSTILVRGVLTSNDDDVWSFQRRVKTLPAAIETPFGTVTLTWNLSGEPLRVGQVWTVTIEPLLDKALECLSRLGVTKMDKDDYSDRWIIRYVYKMSSIVKLTYIDTNKRRGIDVINQLVSSYNRQANSDKNEIAQRTADFVNERIARLSDELSQTDESVIAIKQQSELTNLADGARSIEQADGYVSKLTEAEAQGMMIDYLDEYVRRPENRYEIIPSNMGINSPVSESMISKYNKIVQERKRLLQSASEASPQVKTLTAEADEMSTAIKTALQQARHTSGIAKRQLRSQYSSFSGRVNATISAEKALTDIGRSMTTRNRLLKLLLQRREENTIALSSTSNHGKLIDEPLVEGQIRPRLWMAYGIALGVGLGIPLALFWLFGLLKYKIASRKELEELTERPIIAEVPMAGDDIIEYFRMMRTNINFMLRGGENTILFTSSTSGEGKSFCAANLAKCCALLEKKVILCGMDIRRPALSRLFATDEADRDKGLTNLLGMAEVTDDDVHSQIVPSTEPHLDLLQAGPIPPNPTELLGREVFGQVMAILKKDYDYVILDTAPVGLVTDTMLIGRYADMTIFVCRAEYTPNYAIAQLNQLAVDNKLPNTSFVLNGLLHPPISI